MERLKDALHRARREREEGAQTDASKVSPLPVAAADKTAETVTAPPYPMRSQSGHAEKVSVSYTHTAVAQPDAQRLRDHRIVALSEGDPAAAAYKVLRTHVLQRMKANHWRTLAVTSPREGSGKTVTAINLAISLALDVKHTVLLVDLDLRRPSVARYFFAGSVPGISDLITDDRPLSELLINPGIERLVLLPGNHSFTHSSEILSSPQIIGLVEELKHRYQDRLILFDMPPVLSSDDVIAFSPYLDAVMLVAEEGVTSKDELARSIRAIGEEKVLGTVLNKSEEGSRGIGYS